MDWYLQCVKWYGWYVWLIIYVFNSEKGGCWNAHRHFAAAGSFLSQRPSFATSEELSQTD
jgi:hypothetical protein